MRRWRSTRMISRTGTRSWWGEKKGMILHPFLAEVDKLLRTAGYSAPKSPATLLDQWSWFVDECENGYRWDISEYDSELSVRRTLDILLEAKSLSAFAEIAELAGRVKEIDIRSRRLLHPVARRERGETWWEKGILAEAGEAYADYCKSVYGTSIKVKSKPSILMRASALVFFSPDRDRSPVSDFIRSAGTPLASSLARGNV